LVKELTGKPILGLRSRAFSDLMSIARDCEAGQASVLIVDSATHVAREVCQAYLAQVNEARVSQGKSKRTDLEFQDWNVIKPKWAEWTDFYLNSALHIIICGRAGFQWAFERVETDTGALKKQLRKKGVKMKVPTDSEFGFEPSLLVEMRRENVFDERTATQEEIVQRAVVLGDKSAALTGLERAFKTIRNEEEQPDYAAMLTPVAEFFRPHLEMLTPGASNVVDTSSKPRWALTGPAMLNGSANAETAPFSARKSRVFSRIHGPALPKTTKSKRPMHCKRASTRGRGPVLRRT